MPLAGARRTTNPILGSLDTNAAALPDTRASRKRRESLHIADAGCWPDPLEAAVQKQEKQAQKLKQVQEDQAVEEEWQARTFRLDAPISSCLSLMRVSSGHLARSMAKMNSALKLTCWP